jgi:two-component system cell cycle response regulator DivK
MTYCPKRVLIVEDNKVDMRLLTDILEWRGYETLQTGDGLEAISLALAHLPDLILMDIQLPEISGLEVTRRLRDDARSRHTPIVAVTAFAMGWHEREALDSGCDAYISKPISILGLLGTVETFLSRFSHEFSTGFADLPRLLAQSSVSQVLCTGRPPRGVGNGFGAVTSVNRETAEGRPTLLKKTIRVCTFLLGRVVILGSFRSISDDFRMILIIALLGLALSLLAVEHGWIDIAAISW